MAKEAADPEKASTLSRMKMVVAFTAKRDKKFVPIAAAATLGPIILALLLILFAGLSWIWIALGVMLGLVGFMSVVNLRANKVMMADAEETPGAAAQILEQQLKGDWRVTPNISSTMQFDVVHLVIGKPGVILIGEGNPARVRGLIGQEKRRLSKVIGSAEMRDFIVGNNEGEIPLKKLRMTLMRLPRTVTGKDVNALSVRLKALTARPQMPKGAVPKNMRPQSGAFRAPRGR